MFYLIIIYVYYICQVAVIIVYYGYCTIMKAVRLNTNTYVFVLGSAVPGASRGHGPRASLRAAIVFMTIDFRRHSGGARREHYYAARVHDVAFITLSQNASNSGSSI